jgi:hypothetical protein
MMPELWLKADCTCGEVNYIFLGYICKYELSHYKLPSFTCWKCNKYNSFMPPECDVKHGQQEFGRKSQ